MKKHFSNPAFIIALAAFLFFSFIPQPARVDFSGEWKLNRGKSELGQFAEFSVHTIKTNQLTDNISIARTAPSFEGGDNTTNETLSFDGKESTSTVFGNSTKKCTAKWSEDEKALIMTYKLNLEFNGEVMEITGTETWTLEEDGKTFVSKNNSSSSFGDMSTRLVYEKQ